MFVNSTISLAHMDGKGATLTVILDPEQVRAAGRWAMRCTRFDRLATDVTLPFGHNVDMMT